MKLLPTVRLSLDRDESTSPERQWEAMEAYARAHGHELINIGEAGYDLDVSGSIPPWKRPGLGPWFAEERLDGWQALICSKLDRLTRSLLDFETLIKFLQEHQKTLICLDPAIDLTTPAGRAFAQVIVVFAEFERAQIKSRTKEAYDALLRARRYRGGMISFGYQAVTREGMPGKYLEPDPELAPVVREMCERYVAYESFGAIAKWLNAEHVPAPMDAMRRRNKQKMRGTKWQANVVRIVLDGPGIMGAAVDANGNVVRDDAGEVIYMAPPLVDRELWEKVQARIRANPGNTKSNSSALLHVAECSCGGTMYATSTRKTERGKSYEYRYYSCANRRSYDRAPTCQAPRIKAEALEEATFGALLAMAGSHELVEQRLIPGRTYTEDIARVRDLLGRLNADIELREALGDDTAELTAQREHARAELRRLVNLEPEEARIQPVPTGKTFREHWQGLDTVQRNEFLRSAGVRVVAHRSEMPKLKLSPTSGPAVTAADVPFFELVDTPAVKAVVYLGSMANMLARMPA